MTLAAVILTRDEELHIARCVQSLRGIADEIFIVDSGSTDGTVRIAEELGATVAFNPWRNYSTQLNWALDNMPITSDWVLRIDADEYLDAVSGQALKSAIEGVPPATGGLLLRRQIHFLGQWMRHGGAYPIWHLRAWRHKAGRCEDRWMDEHIVLSEGALEKIPADLIDSNLNSLTWWTSKHNSYASREAVDLLNLKYHFLSYPTQHSTSMSRGARLKRQIKESTYSRMPLALRALAYFTYRFIFRLGFLDGYRGLVFHFLQGFWYRFLVDAKVFEVESQLGSNPADVKAVIKERLGVSV